MSALPKPSESTTQVAGRAKPRMIHPCNFRYAGRLSNENARFLTSLHEKFAISLTNSLELYLGTSLNLKLISLEQLAISDYVGSIVTSNYLLPCSMGILDASCLIDIDIALIFPMIDLLLGGPGNCGNDAHELTEIDEEIMESVSALIVKELERSWRVLNLSLTAANPIKPSMIPQSFPANEKLVLLMFEMTLGQSSGSFTIVMPTPFVGYLLRHLKVAQAKKSSLRVLHRPTLRERILDCNYVLSADIMHMRVLLKDLIDLQPGSILKTDSPVKQSGKVTVEGTEIFEALPVRNGPFKAAQITARCQEPAALKEQL